MTKTYSFKLNKEWASSLDTYIEKSGSRFVSEAIAKIVTDFLKSETSIEDVLSKDLTPVDKLKVKGYPIEEWFTCQLMKRHTKIQDLDCLQVQGFRCHAHPACQTNLFQRLGL